ncbi:ABC transporter substrate-binding protein [Paenibacillus qinlingensis]|uniref:ABC transporter substrate-binding protein n=1 Tax=Paenibacillus qinlingensis TaxID=1837343 RepID=UPI0015674D87|nr:ABC transporter substrate-binding protein [Paenibacillus qinlingensis]NQX59961.1 carbohydrate ABC transporter substrate-binding protein [Paenibacillus qinlingensis]
MKVNKIMHFALTFPLTISLVTGCSLGSSSNEKMNEHVKLRIMHESEEGFYQQYGMLFSALYPDIELEVVSAGNLKAEQGQTYQELISTFVNRNNPDILLLDSTQYAKMSAEGRLMDLELLTKKDKFDEDQLIPGVMDYLREKGGGKLNGLPTEFYSTAVYYNKDLFDKYGISYPKNKMSWDELILLASRFPTDEKDKRMYGLKMGEGQENLFQLGDTIGRTRGLSYVNSLTKQITINTESWNEVYETALKAFKSNAIYHEDPPTTNGPVTMEEFLLRDPFIAGKVAMTIDGSTLMETIKQAQRTAPDKAVSHWDMVTMPVNPQEPDYGVTAFYPILAINSKSSNVEAAKTFINYIHSKDYVRVLAKAKRGGGLPIRKEFIKDDQGHHMEAFYELKPSLAENDTYKDFDKLPEDFIEQFNVLADRELQASSEGKVSIHEALDSLQSKTQAALEESAEANVE